MKAKKSVGIRLIEGLTEFAEALESGESLELRLTGHRVVINLTPGQYSGQDVRATRRLLGVSQSLFAVFIGVASGTVQAWEQGRNVPSGAAARLLDEIRLNPEFWKVRIASTLKRVSTKNAGARRRARRMRANSGQSGKRTTARVTNIASGTGSMHSRSSKAG
jgi:putative transcriptional regulator